MSARSELFSPALRELVSYNSRDVGTSVQIGKSISAHQIGRGTAWSPPLQERLAALFGGRNH